MSVGRRLDVRTVSSGDGDNKNNHHTMVFEFIRSATSYAEDGAFTSPQEKTVGAGETACQCVCSVETACFHRQPQFIQGDDGRVV
jgi:hypothetical protein